MGVGSLVGWWTHLQNGFLPLDARHDGVLLDVNHEVARLEVAGYGNVNVDIADGLPPFVGEGVLLGLFLGAGGGFFGGGGLCVGLE
jgi:hypothetical protein